MLLETKKPTDFKNFKATNLDDSNTSNESNDIQPNVEYPRNPLFLLILMDFSLGLAALKIFRKNSKIDISWLRFISSAICFGALSSSSPWNPQELQLFIDNFGEDYINLLISQENHEDNFYLLPLNSHDSSLNDTYLRFLVKHK